MAEKESVSSSESALMRPRELRIGADVQEFVRQDFGTGRGIRVEGPVLSGLARLDLKLQIDTKNRFCRAHERDGFAHLDPVLRYHSGLK